MVTVSASLVAPAATTTDVGIVATAELAMASATVVPPVGAAPFRLTVTVTVFPPAVDAGETESDDSESGATVTAAVFDTPA